jgi:hypothetical protein
MSDTNTGFEDLAIPDMPNFPDAPEDFEKKSPVILKA